MFRYYHEALTCYVFLPDLGDSEAHQENPARGFEESEWFTRGWTLQEMLAPEPEKLVVLQ